MINPLVSQALDEVSRTATYSILTTTRSKRTSYVNKPNTVLNITPSSTLPANLLQVKIRSEGTIKCEALTLTV